MTTNAFDDDGFVFIDSLVDQPMCTALATQLTSCVSGAGQRHLIDHPAVIELLNNPRVITTIRNLLGEGTFAYKATLFDKHSERNWLVAWHQDASIPVAANHNVQNWGGWSVKEGVDYVQPPDDLLANLVALRIHLDDCSAENGPLRVLVGSHKMGRMVQSEIALQANAFLEHTLVGGTGSAMLMRPLLIHASSKALSDKRRRVLHLEFAACALPMPLAWHRCIAL